MIEMSKILNGTEKYSDSLLNKIILIKQTLLSNPELEQSLYSKLRKLELALKDIDFKLNGHKAKASREEIPPTHVPLFSRFSSIHYSRFMSTSKPATNMLNSFNILKEELIEIIKDLKTITESIKEIDQLLNKKKTPWTIGRIIEF